MAENLGNLLLENVRIGFRNFSGAEGRYNREGVKTFVVFLETKFAESIAKDGWNVKFLQPREEGDEPQAFLPVTLAYSNRPPLVALITSHGPRNLDETTVSMLDWADIVNVDLIVRPYVWEVRGQTGVKAYVKTMYVTIEEDELERKYGVSE